MVFVRDGLGEAADVETSAGTLVITLPGQRIDDRRAERAVRAPLRECPGTHRAGPVRTQGPAGGSARWRGLGIESHSPTDLLRQHSPKAGRSRTLPGVRGAREGPLRSATRIEARRASKGLRGAPKCTGGDASYVVGSAARDEPVAACPLRRSAHEGADLPSSCSRPISRARPRFRSSPRAVC